MWLAYLGAVPVTIIRLIAVPIRRAAKFPLVQLLATIAVILWLQAADTKSIPGEIFTALDWLVDFSVRQCALLFEVRSFTRSWLFTFFSIAYVYIAALVIIFILEVLARGLLGLMARHNVLWVRSSIARERGIAAYRAWLPLERIRPANIPQPEWEERYAWPADGSPPYPPLSRRIARVVALYLVGAAIVIALLQLFTPFPVATWLAEAAKAIWTHLLTALTGSAGAVGPK